MQRSTFLIAVTSAAALPLTAGAKTAGASLDARAAIPVVRARAAGRDLRLAIDTADAVSTLSVEAAGALGLSRTPVAGSSDARAMLGGVVIAENALRDHPALVTDVSRWTALAGFAVDGSLGYEAFRDRVVTIDYKNHALVFPETLPDGETAAITWLRHDDRSPQLITFDGLSIDGFPVTAQLDTTLSKNLIVFTAKVPNLLIDDAPKAPLYTYGDVQLVPGRVGSVRLGITTLMASGVVVYQAGANARVPATGIAAVAGDGLFAGRAVTLDFPNSTLIVT